MAPQQRPAAQGHGGIAWQEARLLVQTGLMSRGHLCRALGLEPLSLLTDRMNHSFHSLQFQLGVDLLIASNIARRSNHSVGHSITSAMAPHTYAAEFCTVHVNTARQIGKTHYIKTHATKDDLVVVMNHNTRRTLENEQSWPFQLCTIADVESSIVQRRYDRVYVDEPSHCFRPGNMKLEHFYHLLMQPGPGSSQPTFIFLGTGAP